MQNTPLSKLSEDKIQGKRNTEIRWRKQGCNNYIESMEECQTQSIAGIAVQKQSYPENGGPGA